MFCAILHRLAPLGVAATAKSETVYKGEEIYDHTPLTIGYGATL
jgi:hypothetical protein